MPSRPAQPRTADHLRLVTPAPAAAAAVSLRPKGSPRTAAAKAPPTRFFADWALQGLGVSAATASAGFATYALVFSTGTVVPSGNFNIFARYDHLYQSPTIRRGASPGTETATAPDASPLPRRDAVAARTDDVDFTPTGSLSAPGDGAGSDAGAGQAGTGRPAAASRALPNFKLRDVFDGKALIESRSSLSVVKPGSVLDGAGQVLSIEKRGDQWVVLTQNGIIAGQRK